MSNFILLQDEKLNSVIHISKQFHSKREWQYHFCMNSIIKLDTIQQNFLHTHWTELYMLPPGNADVHRNISAHIFAADIF